MSFASLKFLNIIAFSASSIVYKSIYLAIMLLRQVRHISFSLSLHHAVKNNFFHLCRIIQSISFMKACVRKLEQHLPTLLSTILFTLAMSAWDFCPWVPDLLSFCGYWCLFLDCMSVCLCIISHPFLFHSFRCLISSYIDF